MATQTLFQENYLALTGMVKHWDRRLRLRQTLLWLPRSLMPGLLIGLLLAIISRTRPWLMPQQVALITGALVALGTALFALVVWLWRRSALISAQRFDVQFRLNERVSTALELGGGTIHSVDELTLRQLADARVQASAVRVRDYLPLALSRQDWMIAIVLAAVLALLLILPNSQLDALTQASVQRSAIDNAAEQMRETTQDVAADTSLGNEERRALLEQLKTATDTLEQPNITPEEAFAALSDVQSDLQDSADDLNREASLNQAALQQAADALQQAAQQAANNQQTGTMEQVTQNLDQIAQDASEMTPAERQQAEQALQNAAQALQSTNPQAAQALQQAAQQMQQETDPQQLQQQLEQAEQQMQQQAQEAQQQQQAAQNLDNEAQQAQQAAEQISQAQQQAQQNQQGQQENQQGDQQSQQGQQQGQQQGEQSQQGQKEGQQPGEQSQQGQNGSQAQQSQQQGENASQQQGSQASDQAQQGQPGSQANQPGNAAQQAQALAAGDQAGDQQQGDSQATAQQQAQQSQQNNNADGQGEREFEAVNVPRRIGPQANGSNNIELDPDASDAPAQEGDFTENPTGQVTVPYDQVFSDYADAANRALDSDYVPLGLRDVVRDYFTSLEPRR